MELTCRKCGKIFHVPKQGNNARKYCNTCQIAVYREHRKKARMKYNKLHPVSRGRVRSCNWCGVAFHSVRGQLYCSPRCRKFARMEQNNIHQKRYRQRHGKSEKQGYFDNLGNSNLGGHRVESDDEELKKIKREKRRLKI